MFSRTFVFGDQVWPIVGQPVFALSSYDVAAFAMKACRAEAGLASEGWWSQTGSNRRPHACKARALPAELWPRTRRRILLVARPVRSPSPALRRSSLVQEGLPSRSCRAAKAGGPGKT